MDVDRLAVLLELSRYGSMRAVADVTMTSTSTVSQQIAALAREVGVPLVERDGRGIRLTPAGRRLAGHAVTILAAVEAARADLDAAADPAGTIRASGFATAVRRMLVPVAAELAGTHPRVRVVIHELEPDEARDALLADRVDLALVYDYDLAPATVDRLIAVQPLGHTPLGLAVPAEAAPEADLSSPELFARFERSAWIGNSRNPAEERLLRVIASMAGFEPRVDHLADSLDLVEELVLAGLGVGLLPVDRDGREGLTVLPLRQPAATNRTYVWTRQGRADWPPLALVLDKLTGDSRPAPLAGLRRPPEVAVIRGVRSGRAPRFGWDEIARSLPGDDHRLAARRLKLGSQPADVHADVLRLRLVPLAPDPAQQVRTGQQLPLVDREFAQ
jgi:DNA-binding transcriptional LysR family regulator